MAIQLKRFHTIIGDNVRLGKEASMNSEVIEILDKNIIVAVMETKDRKWIFVKVLKEYEKFQGWVNHTYTKRLAL